MSDRYDIKAWRLSRNDKAYTVRIGSAYVDQKGVTRLEFDALPIPDKGGRVACFLEAQKPREDANDKPATRQPANRADLDDDIPF